MTLTNEDIKKFQTLYKEQFGMEISKEQAAEEGLKLIRLLVLIYGPSEKSG